MNNTDKATNGSTRKDSDANRDYYQQMYDKIHISQDLEERLMDMYKMNNNVWKQKKSTRRTAWKVVAAVAALSIVVPTGAYAASHYFGIADFFSLSGRKLNQDANKLIEKEITQIPEKETASELPVTFTVQEALCDSGTVNIVVEAKANERGKYLLVPQDALESDSVENLGIDSTETIAEYAKEKKLEILYVDSGFKVGSPYFPGVSSYYNKSFRMMSWKLVLLPNVKRMIRSWMLYLKTLYGKAGATILKNQIPHSIYRTTVPVKSSNMI